MKTTLSAAFAPAKGTMANAASVINFAAARNQMLRTDDRPVPRLQCIRFPSVVPDLALMPVPQCELRDPRRERGQHYTGQRNEKQSREESRNVELEARQQNLIGETGNGSSGTSDEFRDDGADQRQSRRDPQAGEEVWQRTRHAQAHQRLPPARSIQAEEIGKPGVDAAQAERGVRNDRKQRHDGGADHQRNLRVVDPDDDERRDGDDGSDLEQYRVGKEARLDYPALHEHERDRHTENDSRSERGERN